MTLVHRCSLEVTIARQGLKQRGLDRPAAAANLMNEPCGKPDRQRFGLPSFRSSSPEEGTGLGSSVCCSSSGPWSATVYFSPSALWSHSARRVMRPPSLGLRLPPPPVREPCPGGVCWRTAGAPAGGVVGAVHGAARAGQPDRPASWKWLGADGGGAALVPAWARRSAASSPAVARWLGRRAAGSVSPY